jgi:hypothetical protein
MGNEVEPESLASGSSRLMVGWRNPSFICTSRATSSTSPAAVRQCPSMDLVALMECGTRASPNTCLIASTSAASARMVEVPWALM